MDQYIRYIKLKNEDTKQFTFCAGCLESGVHVAKTIKKGASVLVDLAKVKTGEAKFAKGDLLQVSAMNEQAVALSKVKYHYRKNSIFIGEYTLHNGRFEEPVLIRNLKRIKKPRIRHITVTNNTDGYHDIVIHLPSWSYPIATLGPGETCSEDLAFPHTDHAIEEGDEVWVEVLCEEGYMLMPQQRFVFSSESKKEARFILGYDEDDICIIYDSIVEKKVVYPKPIRAIELDNEGAFVAKIRVKFGDGHSFSVGHSILKGHSLTVDIAESYGKIKEGETVWLETVVVGGTNNKARERFTYSKSSDCRASYKITGTTVNNVQKFISVNEHYAHQSEPIRFFELNNNGGLVARIRIHGGPKSFNKDSRITLGNYNRVDLSTIPGIKEGDEVWMEVVVDAGTNHTTLERFTYNRWSDAKACFAIGGTTADNTVEYIGTYKIGVPPEHPVTYEEIKAKIDAWEQKKNVKGVWKCVTHKQIVEGLRIIVSAYFEKDETDLYTKVYSVGHANMLDDEWGATHIFQGQHSSMCGPASLMFYLAKLNISTFVDTIIQLFEDGHFMGYLVPKRLRNLGKEVSEKYIEDNYINGDKIGEIPENTIGVYFNSGEVVTENTGLCCVCWMFQAALAQKESIFPIELEHDEDDKSGSVTNHTRFTEMKRDIKFVFNASNIVFQSLAEWDEIGDKYKKRIPEWIDRLNKPGGVIFWEMHGHRIHNDHPELYKSGSYSHADPRDLHWVPVWKFEKYVKEEYDGTKEDRVRIYFHTWGRLFADNYAYGRFQDMSYAAYMVTIK